jgi:AMMECR1 domain-containing protein
MKIETILTVAKGFSLKREKTEDAELVYAHLKFGEMFLTREQIDTLLSQREGWARSSLFDPYGAPLMAMDIALPKLELCVVGTIGDAEKEDRLRLLEATLGDVGLLLTTQGAALSGTLTWQVAGDEASDVEPLLGRICSANLTLKNRQGDLLHAITSVTITVEGRTEQKAA